MAGGFKSHVSQEIMTSVFPHQNSYEEWPRPFECHDYDAISRQIPLLTAECCHAIMSSTELQYKVVALGDEDNDIEMLRAVEHGVAMGQASIAVRKAARYTAPSNALDGVAVALETFCGV